MRNLERPTARFRLFSRSWAVACWARRLSLLVASVLIFIGTSVLPGNAASVVLGRGATPSAVQRLDKQMHLDKPLTTQYTNWLGGFVHGDLGDSSIGLAQGQKHRRRCGR